MSIPSVVISSQFDDDCGRANAIISSIEAVIFNEHENPVCVGLVVAVCYDFDNQSPVPVYESIKNDYGK